VKRNNDNKKKMSDRKDNFVVIKTTYQGDTRRTRVSVQDLAFDSLAEEIRRRYALSPSIRFRLTYEDDEGDRVTIASDDELREAVRLTNVMMRRNLRLKVIDVDAPPSVEKVETAAAVEEDPPAVGARHWGFTCDVTGQHPIVGPRYHKIGENYDLCESAFAALPPEERDVYERIDVPLRGRWWARCGRSRFGGRGRGRSHRGNGGGRGRHCRGRHDCGRRGGGAIPWIKRAFRTLRDADVEPLIRALSEAGGAAARVAPSVRTIASGLKHPSVAAELDRLRRSPAVRALRRRLRDMQVEVGLCELPSRLIATPEWTAALAALREIAPDLARASNAIADAASELRVQIPSLLPTVIPALFKMSVGRSTRPAAANASSSRPAIFEADVTLPDGTIVAAGAKALIKTWRVAAKAPWPEDTALLHVGGDMELRPTLARIPIGATAAGESRELSVELTAPTRPGRFWSYWRLVSDSRPELFGLRVWADLRVADDDHDKMLGSATVAAAAGPEEEAEASPSKTSDDDLVVVDTPDEPAENLPGADILRAMGFDPEVFRDRLRAHNGDVRLVLSEILSEDRAR